MVLMVDYLSHEFYLSFLKSILNPVKIFFKNESEIKNK